MKNPVFFLTALSDLAVITLTGTDAASFLQSQITQDVDALGQDTAALAGYCNPRGRLLASMIVLQQGREPSDGWLLLTKADVALSFAQRLRMFVMRANVDVQISNATVTGVVVSPSDQDAGTPGSTASPSGGALDPEMTLNPPSDAPSYTVVRRDAHVWIRAPRSTGASQARWWLAGSPVTGADTSDAGVQAWQAEDIAAGLPWVQAATQQTFIPQTLNMDLIDGVSFTKGCYPGQEVVARSHYRGTVRRRMAYVVGTGVDLESVDDLIGIDTFNANKPDNPCGRVINAAVSDATLHALIEVRLADLDNADFRLGSGDGPAITLCALPYQIVSDAAT